MSSVNRVILIGRLGEDPATNTNEKGTIANLSIATSESWKTKDGEKQERTEWHRVVVYGQPAKFADEYLKKGAQVYIEGSLRTRKWQDKEGKERYTTEIVAERLKALSTKRETKDDEDDRPY